MKRSRIYWTAALLLTVIAVPFTGCRNTPANDAHGLTAVSGTPQPIQGETSSPAPTSVPEVAIASRDYVPAAAPVNSTAPDNPAAPATAADVFAQKQVASTAAASSAVEYKTAQDKFNENEPSLLGLKMKATKADVSSLYGEPVKQFVMEDEQDPITVYDYKSFSVGFSQKGELQFIDISTDTVNPGLNGLRVGMKSKDAIQALGNPNSNTSFVLTYKSKGAVLKLDIDPKEDSIRSIKLFKSN
ncbi:hypothetical protein [Paenibacillus sp. y28]|uniref:hypothetical protein n=1 Tax=Paenibacillus sp. y28 TaxID=3129110 RepID=UPI003016A6B8